MKRFYKSNWFIAVAIVVGLAVLLAVLYCLAGLFAYLRYESRWYLNIEYEEHSQDLNCVALYAQETFSDQAPKTFLLERSEDGYLCFYDRKNDVYHSVPKEISGALVNITMGDPDIFHDGYVYAIVIRTDGSVVFSGDETCPLKLVYSPNGKPDFDVDVKIKKADENWYYVKQI